MLPDLSERKAQARRVVRQLKKDYADAECALNFDSPYQLLIATILSAQCTDVRVNIVTKDLFAQYPDAEAMAKAKVPKLEKIIQTTGFFRNKAKNIHAASQALVDQYDGEVPQELDKLVALPGVGRKTANVVLGTAFGIPSGVVVDTHVGRLTRRLGLTDKADAVKVEKELMEAVPKKEWIDFSHRLIHHGRAICAARKPKCDKCHFLKFCPQVGV
ncbi:endonuclease III [Blastopirellula marina]|uniref:Endonuclease III n=1 Tax=Blastopirellula marina TaxID=124 RepID=A0A2S8GD25_9BACT|nr:endonuclease III [Blastopirellula marina]PQO42333.1 endonuclease III [Blastopirellula marina]